jgi:hypothetical protein
MGGHRAHAGLIGRMGAPLRQRAEPPLLVAVTNSLAPSGIFCRSHATAPRHSKIPSDTGPPCPLHNPDAGVGMHFFG